MLKLTESKGGNSKYPLPKQGNRIARLIGIIDLGVQPREFKGEVKSPARQATFVFELPNDTMEYKGEVKPQQAWVNNVNLIGGQEKAKITQILAALSPDKAVEDLSEVLENVCMINFTHRKKQDGTDRAVPIGFSPLPDIPGLEVPEQQIPTFVFDTEDPKSDAWGRVPKWVKGVIGESLDKPKALVDFLYATAESEAAATPEASSYDEDDIPF